MFHSPWFLNRVKQGEKTANVLAYQMPQRQKSVGSPMLQGHSRSEAVDQEEYGSIYLELSHISRMTFSVRRVSPFIITHKHSHSTFAVSEHLYIIIHKTDRKSVV